MNDDARLGQSTRGASAPRRNGGNGSVAPDTDELMRSLERAGSAMGAYLRAQMHQSPYLTLGVAAVAGYVLGAGVPPRIAGVLVSMAGRQAIGDIVAGALGAGRASDA